MNETKARKIGAITLVVLGLLIFAICSTSLILTKLSLLPWSVQVEGKYVAYGLKIWGFLWTIPFIISLFLLAYLIHPSRFEKFSIMIRILLVLLAISGFGIAALLIASAIINIYNLSAAEDALNLILFSILGTSPSWIMGILSIIAFKKDKFEKIKKEYKVIIFAVLGFAVALVGIITITHYFLLSIQSHVVLY